MVREPQLDNSAPWKQRFRAPVITSTQIARLAPTRGLVMTNRSGIYQPYCWDVPTGELRQFTDRFEGLLYRVISPNGRHVYCFADTKGNEIGHFIRIPFEGGEALDVTPNMPPYPTFGLELSGRGNLLAFTTAVADEYQVYAVDIGLLDALGSPRLIYRSKTLILPPCLSYDGRIAVVAVSRGSKLLFGLSLDEIAPSFFVRDRERSRIARNLWFVLRDTVSSSAFRIGATAAKGFPFFTTITRSFLPFGRIWITAPRPSLVQS